MRNPGIKLTGLWSLLLLLGACEGAMDGSVVIPETDVICESTACRGASGVQLVFVYITQSSCDSPFYNQAALITGNGEVNCNSLGCAGEVLSWSNQGDSVTMMEKGTYSVCSFINLVNHGNPGTGYNASGNTKYTDEGVAIGSSVLTLSLEDWVDN